MFDKSFEIVHKKGVNTYFTPFFLLGLVSPNKKDLAMFSQN